jgi:hypothetical protein
MAGRHERRPRHSAYTPEERGRRVVWRAVTVTIYLVLCAGALWFANVEGWPFRLVLGPVAVPYWLGVTAIWSRHGPDMPGL